MPAWYTKALVQTVLDLCNRVALRDLYHCNVKIISIILSIVILSMVLMPCADEPVSSAESQSTILLDHSDNHDAEHHDLCSPFCSCECCHSNYSHGSILDLAWAVLFDQFSIEHSFTFHSRISFSIWDPPSEGQLA